MTEIKPRETALSKLGDLYDGNGGPALVALLALVDPTCGVTAASIGSLLSYAKTQRDALKADYFAYSIKKRLDSHEKESLRIDENLHEAMKIALRGVEDSVTISKIERFSKIIAGHISKITSWDETATALRMLTDLEDIHITILSETSQKGSDNEGKYWFYIKEAGFNNMAFSENGRNAKPTFDILSVLPDGYHSSVVKLFSMQLMAKGLLHDNDQGHFDQGPVFTLTDAAIWFMAKIELASSNQNG